MTLTLPQSKGGLKTYNGAGAVIMRSTDDAVEIFVDLQVDADAVVDGTLTVHADATFDGNLTVAGTTDLGGTLTLTANLIADGYTISGGVFTTEGSMEISDNLIDFGSGDTIAGGGGSIALSAATVEASNDLTAVGDVRATRFVPWTVPTITGSRGGNVALADLLSSLDFLGLIADGTSA